MNLSTLGLVFDGISGHFAAMAATLFIDALWQGVLIAGALALCMRFAPRVSAEHRFVVWLAAFAALVGLSMFPLLPRLSGGAAGAVSAQSPEHLTRPWFNVDARWGLAIAGLWLAVSLYRAVALAIHSQRLRKLWKDAVPAELDGRVEALLAAAAADCGRGPVEVCTTKTLQRPSVIGFLRPRILIPDWLFARLTQGELEQIVLHEAEHLRRRDDWTNLAQKLCLVVFPLNPALVWIERRLCREREMACDDGVVRVTHAPRAYAACLTSLAERGLERRVEALSLGAWQRRPELVHRVHSILHGRRGLSPVGTRVMLSMLGCGLLAGSVELAQSPQLVAFVPERSSVTAHGAVHPASENVAAKTPVQVATVTRLKSGAGEPRAVSTRSLKGTESVVATNVTLREPSQAHGISPSASPEKDGQITALPAMAKTGKTDGRPTTLQQWVVLTEWEQVETTYNSGSAIADYDTVEPTNGSTGFAAPSRQVGNSRTTITRLIFRVLPASAGLETATKQAASPSASQPDVATFHDGWLVIQL